MPGCVCWGTLVKKHTYIEGILCDECIEWQVNYGCQKFYIYLVKIQIKHLKLPFSLSSIHDQNTIFIQISHIAKSHTHKSI